MINGFGSTPLLGVKYDTRIFKDASSGLGASIGVGAISLVDPDSGHKASLSIGPNYLIGNGTNQMLVGIVPTFIFSRVYPLESSPKNTIKTIFIPEIGYRYSAREKGLSCQLSWNPLFSNIDNKKAFLYFGIGLGYSFK